jgi:hypothetical protein
VDRLEDDLAFPNFAHGPPRGASEIAKALGVSSRPKGGSPGAVPGAPGVGVPSSKKGVTRRGAGGLVTLFWRLVAPASTAATIARGES